MLTIDNRFRSISNNLIRKFQIDSGLNIKIDENNPY